MGEGRPNSGRTLATLPGLTHTTSPARHPAELNPSRQGGGSAQITVFGAPWTAMPTARTGRHIESSLQSSSKPGPAFCMRQIK